MDRNAEPLACRLDALDAGARRRHAALVEEIAREVAESSEVPDGIEVRFPARPYLFLRISEWVELERACCPFLEIAVSFDSGAKQIRVRVTGPPGARELLAAELPRLAMRA